ncbi:MAG: adenosylcobinamide-GDP ribazoletransferase [Lachnospiraceae bacterium]|nr:adenosylcobinamide-GDP ribazoletransferase [Lachnospiraceae bacterium]
MIFLRAIITAFSTYSIIPMPGLDFKEENLRYSLCAFPLIGSLIGLISVLFLYLTDYFAFDMPLLKAAILTFIPIWISGGIHLDGFMDTVDALSSHLPREEKERILKDPNVGAFAVIHLSLLLILTLSIWHGMKAPDCILIIAAYTQSRVLSALALVFFPVSKKSSLLKTYSQASDLLPVRRILIMLEIIIAAIMLLRGIRGIAALLLSLLSFIYYRHRAIKEFGGINGDMAGCFLTLTEFLMLAAFSLIP